MAKAKVSEEKLALFTINLQPSLHDEGRVEEQDERGDDGGGQEGPELPSRELQQLLGRHGELGTR